MSKSALDRNAVRKALFEFILIFVGVLAALAVNQWQQNRKDRLFLTQQLESIVNEVDNNLYTIKNVQNRMIPAKLEALGEVITTLGSSAPQINNPEMFLAKLSISSMGNSVWFTRNRYDALRSSGNFRIIGNRELEDNLSDTYQGLSVLLPQADRLAAGYPALVQQLLPANEQSEHNILRTYIPLNHMETAPVVPDAMTQNEAIKAIIAEREQLVRLARSEVAVTTANWYALERIKMQFEKLRVELLAHPALKGVQFNDAQDSAKK